MTGAFSLSGIANNLKTAVKVVTVVAEIASFIPGPVGMVASGVAAVGYAIQGDYTSAAIAVGGIALAAVGAGAVALALKKTSKFAKPFKSSITLGKAAHNQFDVFMAARGGQKVTKSIAKGGRAAYPDSLINNSIPVELKPHNPRAINRGLKQLARYEKIQKTKGQLWVYTQQNGKFYYKRIR